jgi:rhodanese-related sulfurtransferase
MVHEADVRQLSAALAAGATVIDVREPFEYASGHVPGAISIPMHLVPLRVEEIPTDGDVFVVCAGGNRSWQVCNYLGQRGIEAINVTGGTHAWASAGFAVDTTPAGVVAVTSEGTHS